MAYTFRIEVAKREGAFNHWTAPAKKSLTVKNLTDAVSFATKNAHAGIPTRLCVGKKIVIRALNYGGKDVNVSMSIGTLNTLLDEVRK